MSAVWHRAGRTADPGQQTRRAEQPGQRVHDPRRRQDRDRRVPVASRQWRAAQGDRWVRPRDPWLLDRAFQQPLELLPRLLAGVSLYLEAAAQAEDVTDLFRRLEACGQLIRLDLGVEPAMFRCATVSQDELVSLRSIKNVIRLGRVTRIAPDQIKLADGSIPADRGQVHVDCSAARLRTKPARPVFNGGQITLQQIRACQPVFSAALTGYIEATCDGDARKNLICPANQYPDAAVDWIPLTCTAQRAEIIWATDPDLICLDATIPAQRHLRHGRSPRRPVDGISAHPPVHQY